MQYPPHPPPAGYAYRQVPYAVECPVCEGRGSIRTLTARGETCPECDGAGSIVAMSWETVPVSTSPASTTLQTRTTRKARRAGCLAPVILIGAVVVIAIVLLYRPAPALQASCSYSYASGVNFQETGAEGVSCSDITAVVAQLGGGDLTSLTAVPAGPVVCQGTWHQDHIVVRDQSVSESLGHQLCDQLAVEGMTSNEG